MRKLLDDESWALIAPLLPTHPPQPRGGRPFVDDRAALTGICVRAPKRHSVVDAAGRAGLRLGRDVLAKAARLAGRRRLGGAAPHAAGTPGRRRPARLEPREPERAQSAGEKGGACTGPNPTDRARAGSKHYLIVERGGVPLASLLTAANAHDSTAFGRLLDAVPSVRNGRRGRPRRRPAKLHADRGYDYARCRRACRHRGIQARIARRGQPAVQRLGRHRWVVERTFAWLAFYRRLNVRYERRDDIHQAFLTLACSLICFNHVKRL